MISELNIDFDSKDIRRVYIEGKSYYSAIDVITTVLQMDYKSAQNYYHVMKSRLRESGIEIRPYKLRAIASDKKTYITDFLDIEAIQAMKPILERTRFQKLKKQLVKHTDEVGEFHPKVMQHLQDKGYQIQHHYKLRSGSIIDVIAYKLEKIYIVECKTHLSRGNFYNAIGQLLCYIIEYGENSIPMLASYNTEFSEDIYCYCRSIGIETLEISL